MEEHLPSTDQCDILAGEWNVWSAIVVRTTKVKEPLGLCLGAEIGGWW
jgi:hypothetical protein